MAASTSHFPRLRSGVLLLACRAPEARQPQNDARPALDVRRPSYRLWVCGAATAYHIVKDNPSPPSIVILEARKAASGATGRNGGHVKPDTYFNVPKYTKLYGPEMAAKLAAFESSQVLAVKELVEKEKIDCDFHLTRTIDVYLDAQNAQDTEAAYRELVKAGVVDMKDVAFTPQKRCREGILGSNFFLLAQVL
jgi:hypothetical protein